MAPLKRIPRFAVCVALYLCASVLNTKAATVRVAGPTESIQAAIVGASHGDTIMVAPGTYVEAFNFAGKNVRVISEEGPEKTIVVAPANIIYAVGFDAGEGRGAELRGFTLANSGGGLIIRANCSPTIVGNVITNCNEGLLIFGSPLISSNRVMGSKANAVRLVDLPVAIFEDNLFEKNKVGLNANQGGGSVFRRNIFRQNTDTAVAIHFGDIDFIQNLFINNSGHAIVIDIGVNQRVKVLHNLFLNNGLAFGAAVTFNGQFGQSVIANNIVIGNFGLVCVNGGSNPLPGIRNNNVVCSAGNAYTGQLTDLTGQFGNISAPTQFLNGGLGDYRLLASSPEIDAGSVADSVELDFSGGPRSVDGNGDSEAKPDIGPFEYAPGPPRASTTVSVISNGAAVDLGWTFFDQAVSYEVGRSISPEGPFESIGAIEADHFVDSTGVNGAIYYYAVKGRNSLGWGANSQPLKVRFGNYAPAAVNDTIETDEEKAVDFDFMTNDSDQDADPLSFEILQLPGNGTATVTGSQVRFAPKLNYSGTEQLIYRVTDGFSGVSTGAVEIVVRPINDPPTIHLSVCLAASERLQEVPIEVIDPDDTEFTFEITKAATNGVATRSDDGKKIFYRSRHLFKGQDHFSYKVSDGAATSAAVNQSVIVNAAPDLDKDGMPDAWESGFDLGDPAGDRDGDGVSNLSEFLAWTSPVDATSVFRVLSLNPENGGVRVTWSSVGGVRYRILKTPKLGVDSPLVEIVRPLTEEVDQKALGEVGTNSYFDAGGEGGFYMIRAIP